MHIGIIILCVVLVTFVPMIMAVISTANKTNEKVSLMTLVRIARDHLVQHPFLTIISLVLVFVLLASVCIGALFENALGGSSIRIYAVDNDTQYPLKVRIENDIPIGELLYTLDGTNPAVSSTAEKYTDEFLIFEPCYVTVQRRLLGMFFGESVREFTENVNYEEDDRGVVTPEISGPDASNEPEPLIDEDEWIFVGEVVTIGAPTDTETDRYVLVGFDWEGSHRMPKKIWHHYVRKSE